MDFGIISVIWFFPPLDSDVSEEFDNHSDNSDRVMSSTSEDDFQLDFSYSSETSIPSSQQQWHHENRKPTHKVC